VIWLYEYHLAGRPDNLIRNCASVEGV
jgi:hypothetical protein